MLAVVMLQPVRDQPRVGHHRVEVVEAAGLVDTEWYVRGRVTARGETTDRLYVVGRTPA